MTDQELDSIFPYLQRFTVVGLTLALAACSQGSGSTRYVGSGSFTSPAAVTTSGLVLRDPQGYDWQSERLNSLPAGYVSDVTTAPLATGTFAASVPAREVLVDGVAEGSFQTDVSSFLVSDSSLLAITSTRGVLGGADVYERSATGWNMVLDGQREEGVLAELLGDVYAISGEIDGGPATVMIRLANDPSWIPSPGTLPIECVPSAATSYQGEVWLGAGPTTAAGPACLHRGTWAAEFREVPLPVGASPGVRQEITALLEVPRGLVVALASFDATSGDSLAGSVLLYSSNSFLTLLSYTGEAPLALEFQDETLYVGTSTGRLQYLDSSGRWQDEPGLPSNLGIHALHSPDRNTLVVGAAGPTGALFLRRTARSGGATTPASGASGGGPDYVSTIQPFLVSCAGCHATMPTTYVLSAGLGDPNADYQATLGQLNTTTPTDSPLLLYGANLTPHTGGGLWQVDGTQWTAIVAWIGDGAPFESAANGAPASPPADANRTPTYVQDAKPLLASCATVGCHADRTGYRLTAGLVDDSADYQATLGRVNLGDPPSSSLLRNAAGQGHPLTLYAVGSAQYNTLQTWIEKGAPFN